MKNRSFYYYFASKEDRISRCSSKARRTCVHLLHQGCRRRIWPLRRYRKERARRLGPKQRWRRWPKLSCRWRAKIGSRSVSFLSHIFAVDADRPPCSAVSVEQVPHTLILAAIESGVASGELAGDPRLLECLSWRHSGFHHSSSAFARAAAIADGIRTAFGAGSAGRFSSRRRKTGAGDAKQSISDGASRPTRR